MILTPDNFSFYADEVFTTVFTTLGLLTFLLSTLVGLKLGKALNWFKW